ncbi:MAG: biotin synthase BioB [Bacteroidales bacterium]|nr:biotin synthase BioB [Bacteroidales bacterium]
MTFKEIKELKDRIIAGGNISRDEAIRLSQTQKIDTLYYSANQLRAKFCGFTFEMCSNFNVVLDRCEEDCHWCPLSKASTIDYYVFEKTKIESLPEKINDLSKKGIKRIELSTTHQKLSDAQLDTFIGYYKEIAKKTNIKLCASLGSLSYNQLKRLKEETKISRYHCNLETSENLYSKLCTTGSYQKKIQTLKDAAELGFEVCSGCIIGMGESMEDRIDQALKFRELGIKSISINILFAFNGTPFERHPLINSQEILTTFAIFRFINPKARIRFARGRSLIKIIEKDALKSGINASLVGELLVAAQDPDIDNDINIFESEGFKI